MYRVELFNINRQELQHSDWYHYDLLNGETTYCRLFISETLNNIIKRYIPSGIELFHQSTAKSIKDALTELHDRMLANCNEDFNPEKYKNQTLVNAIYAIKEMKSWCVRHEHSIFKIRKSNAEN